MVGEMIVWGFFSAIGWMAANWTVEKAFPEKEKPQVVQQEIKKDDCECNTVHKTKQ
jgi:hypothetical protein